MLSVLTYELDVFLASSLAEHFNLLVVVIVNGCPAEWWCQYLGRRPSLTFNPQSFGPRGGEFALAL
jgi:hypothetical protein